jgi:2'-5' RNA ligase
MKTYMDHMLVLSPPEGISRQIGDFKKDAAGIIGPSETLRGKAHLSLKTMPRRKPYLAEPELLGLKKNLQVLPPVQLCIDGFDYFSHGEEYRTIYAKIRSTYQTTHWLKYLKKNLSIRDYLVLHITIARNIHRTAFDKLWPHFKDKPWVEAFWVSSVTVLQKEALNSFAHWEIFTELPFEANHLPQETPARPPVPKPVNEGVSKSQQISLF